MNYITPFIYEKKNLPQNDSKLMSEIGCSSAAIKWMCFFCLRYTNLEHGVGEEGLQSPLLTVGLGLILLQQLVKVSVLLAVSQNLQAVLVVPHKLLVDIQHGQQDVEQVGCRDQYIDME